jgi:hypothetical protein
MGSQNIYEYKKVDQITVKFKDEESHVLKNKVNEVVVEYNHMAKDLELYKKAYKDLALRVKELEDNNVN